MKLLPSRKQWKKWTLPSKASYIGIVIAIFLFAIQILINFIENKKGNAINRPQIIIETQNKPYLRYHVQNDSSITFSYELGFKNNGINIAENINYTYFLQRLIKNNETMTTVVNLDLDSSLNYTPPETLASKEKYYQIFKLNGHNISTSELNNLIEGYENQNLSIEVKIHLKYKDQVTQKSHNTTEILNIYKDKVYIVESNKN